MNTVPQPTDRAWLMRRRSDIVNALGAVKDDPTGTGRSVVAQCMQVVADELQKLADEIAPPITDPVELAAAYKLNVDFSTTCLDCGGQLIDGVCQGAENCQDPTCTRACCAHKRQGPVAVQRPGMGAN